ncbi:MAG: hypothetical protein K0M67_12620 [Thiobacillus sp.]|nr:hypothetical protein [Thiobacillus sp.]
MPAFELAGNRMPQEGMHVHRGLLYDRLNLEAVARHAIACQPRFSHLTLEAMVRRIWSELAHRTDGFSAEVLEDMADQMDTICGVYFTISWNELEAQGRMGALRRGRLIIFLARLGRPVLTLVPREASKSI